MTGWMDTFFTVEHWTCLGLTAGAMMALGMLWRQERRHSAERMREQALRAELEAYARLDATLPPDGEMRELGVRVCRTVAQKSLFQRAALLVEDAERRLFVAGSAGFDDVTVAALNEWGAERVRGGKVQTNEVKFGADRSFLIKLRMPLNVFGEMDSDDGCRMVIAIPMETHAGRMAGVLAVCSDGVPERMDSLTSLEALAVKLGRTMENRQLMERLVRAEKMAGLGQLADGVAHELNNPLTAVLGYAELIAESSSETRVCADARTIVQEALRMQKTVESLQRFWRPTTQADEPVQIGDVMLELAADHADKLTKHGVRMVVETGENVPPVRGDRARLRTVLEHLLNNAGHAVGAYKNAAGEEPMIRMTLSYDTRSLQVVVSDTGAGFNEPARVFDPFYTTRQPGEGMGMGLSESYGIVHEHGGEISAYNLRPHGAVVVVELPLRKVVKGESGTRPVALQA